MRFATILIAFSGVIASTSAARLFARQYPDCAQPCIANADIGTCFADDLNCLCKSPNFISSTNSCIVASCDAADAAAAQATARQFCETVGVTITSVAPASTTAGSGSSAPASGSSTPSGSGSAKPTSTAPSSASASSSGAPAPTQSQSGSSRAYGANALLGLAGVSFVAFAAL